MQFLRCLILGTVLTFFLRPGACPAASDLVINEIMPANSFALQDSDGDFPDWIELHNAGDEFVQLQGYGLSDDPQNPFQWTFPDTEMAPGDFLIIFASGKNRKPRLTPQSNLEFDPGDLPGLQLWLKADAIDPKDPQQLEAGDGNTALRRWIDSSGNEFDAVAPSDGTRPRWVPNALNGRPVVRFTPPGQYLEIPFTPRLNPAELTVLAVAQTQNQPQTQYLLASRHSRPLIHPDESARSGYALFFSDRWDWIVGAGKSRWLHAKNHQPASKGGPTIVSTRYNSFSSTLHLDGRFVADTRFVPQPNRERPLRVGADSLSVAPGGFFQGDLAELLLFDRFITESERRELEQYLAAQYALTTSNRLHANFRLAADGESLYLTQAEGQLVDSVTWQSLEAGYSFARVCDSTTQWAVQIPPTPALTNHCQQYTGISSSPEFSPPGGLYAQPVDVALNAHQPDAQIFFTTDGSVPTQTSSLYSEPLHITESTVLKARTYTQQSAPSRVVTRSYILREGPPLAILSISMKPEDLWDESKGIYVNYSPEFRGKDWERPAHLEFYEPDGTRGFDLQAGVSIQGGWNTTEFPQKSLQIETKSRYGTQYIQYPVFPESPRDTFKSLLLRNSGNDWNYTLFRDALIQSLVSDLSFDTQAYRPVIVYLNGRYWGILNLRERFDLDFLVDRYDVEPSDLTLIKNDLELISGNLEEYTKLLGFVENNDLAKMTHYNHLRSMVDIESLIEYFASEVFIANLDWPGNNIRFWRAGNPQDKWSWMMYDTDLGFGRSVGFRFNMLDYITDPEAPNNRANYPEATLLFRSLLRNTRFQQEFVNRCADLLNDHFKPERVLNQINSIRQQLQPEMPAHIERWADEEGPKNSPSPLPSLEEWHRHIGKLEEFAMNRPEYLREHLVQFFDLQGTNPVRLAVSPSEGGFLTVNRLAVKPGASPWIGQYFQGVPIRLKATPHAGFRFERWSGDVQSNSPDLELNLDQPVQLMAHFRVGQDFQSWLEDHFAPPHFQLQDWVGVHADPDGDNRVNLAEYAFGSDPLMHDASGPLDYRRTMRNGKPSLIVVYPKNKTAAEAQIQLQVSEDLSRWRPFEGNIVPSGSDPIQQIQAELMIPHSELSQHFLRLQIEKTAD